MLKTEMKRAFCSKEFWLTCVIALAMLAFGSSDYLPPNPNKYMGEGWSVATDISQPWWIYYFHCFFMGQRTMLSVFYPILAVVPYVLSYRRDRDSGYRQLVLLKSSRRYYLLSKLIAVVSSTFVAILLPALTWIPVCRLLGNTDWDTALELYGHEFLFAPTFYREHVVLYCVMYAFHAAMLCAVFALLGLGISAVVKNRYLAVLLPFCYAVFSSAILGPLVSKSLAVMQLMPLQFYYYKDVYPLGYWTVPVYEAVLVAVGLALYVGGDRRASKA